MSCLTSIVRMPELSGQGRLCSTGGFTYRVLVYRGGVTDSGTRCVFLNRCDEALVHQATVYERATKVLKTSINKTVGSQIALSRRLGVAALATLPSTKYPTTTHDQLGGKTGRLWDAKPARETMIPANTSTSTSEAPARTRPNIGSWPGQRPPRVSSPHGAPKISAAWNRLMTMHMSAKSRAAK